jgi:hypothetical protein
VAAVQPNHPGEAFRIEHEDAAHVISVYADTNAAESSVMNRLDVRISHLRDLIATKRGGQ